MLLKLANSDISEIYYALSEFIDVPDLYQIVKTYNKFAQARHSKEQFVELTDDEIEKITFVFITSTNLSKYLLPRFESLLNRKVLLAYEAAEQFFEDLMYSKTIMPTHFVKKVQTMMVHPYYEIDTIAWKIEGKKSYEVEENQEEETVTA